MAMTLNLNRAKHVFAAGAIGAVLLSSGASEAAGVAVENVPVAPAKAYAITLTERIGRAESVSAVKYSASVVGLAGQSAQSRILTETAYISGISIEDTGRVRTDVSTLRVGFDFEVSAIPVEGGNASRIRFSVEDSELIAMHSFQTNGHTVQLPETSRARMNQEATLRPGETLVLVSGPAADGPPRHDAVAIHAPGTFDASKMMLAEGARAFVLSYQDVSPKP